MNPDTLPPPVAYAIRLHGQVQKLIVRADVADEVASRMRLDHTADAVTEEALLDFDTVRRLIAEAVAQERERWRVLLMAHRDRTVMSCYASVRECEAARNALQRVLDDIDSRGTT